MVSMSHLWPGRCIWPVVICASESKLGEKSRHQFGVLSEWRRMRTPKKNAWKDRSSFSGSKKADVAGNLI